MTNISVKRVMDADDASDLIGTFVDDSHDWSPNVTQDGIWFDEDTGDPILAYGPFPGGNLQAATVRRAVLSIKVWNGQFKATTGQRNKARTFGVAPRSTTLQRESCRPASIAGDQPDVAAVLENTATVLDRWARDRLPDISKHDRETIEPVLPEWRIGEDTIWTSGVVNYSSKLPFHRDGANFESWSAMPVFRRGTRGGYLHLPEYDLTVACRDGWVVYFPGWRIVHGVTPILKTQSDGYRISIVYYSLRGMKDCHTFAMEQAWGAKRRTEREENMLREGDPMAPTRD